MNLSEDEKEKKRQQVNDIASLMSSEMQKITAESRTKIKHHLFGDSAETRTAACAILLLCLTA